MIQNDLHDITVHISPDLEVVFYLHAKRVIVWKRSLIHKGFDTEEEVICSKLLFVS